MINDTLNKQINKKTKVNRWASPESLANLSESNKRCSDFFLSIFCTFVYKIMLESQDRTDWGSSQGSESRKAWPGQSQLKVLSNWNPFYHNRQLKLWNRWYHTDYLNNFSTSQQSLTSRRPVELKGGLCGLAAFYWALTDTLFTPSQLLRLSLWGI